MIASRHLWLKRLPAALAVAGLAACTDLPRPEAGARMAPPPPRPAGLSTAPKPETTKPSAASAYYTEVQRGLLAQGMMRTDGGGEDAPYNARILTENFIRIALYDEYSRSGAGFVQRESRSVLRRWVVPVRVSLNFGASVPEERRATDRARVSSYLARLAKLTGHPISLVDSGGNFSIHVVNDAERQALGPQLSRDMPGLTAADSAEVTGMSPTTYCLVFALSDGDSGRYTRATAVVRADHPDLLRQSCYHEEIAQGLGLANDSPKARPSIFNDDEEFALLTSQDELMLKMLYSPRLRPGMKEPEVRPVAAALAQELMGPDA